MLGWQFAEDGPKAPPPFGQLLSALGVTMDVSRSQHGLVLVDNAPSRRHELAATIEAILETKHLKRIDAFRLRGRMQFASGQLFGSVS